MTLSNKHNNDPFLFETADWTRSVIQTEDDIISKGSKLIDQVNRHIELSDKQYAKLQDYYKILQNNEDL